MVRAAHGMVAAALSSLGIYYQVQAWPAPSPERADHRHHRLVAGHSAGACFRTAADDEWRGLYFFELGLALVSLACVIALKLPPSDRKKCSRKRISSPSSCWPGMALVCAVLCWGSVVV
jgi:hypothetical protein